MNNKTLIEDLPHLEDIQTSAARKTRTHHPMDSYEQYNNIQRAIEITVLYIDTALLNKIDCIIQPFFFLHAN